MMRMMDCINRHSILNQRYVKRNFEYAAEKKKKKKKKKKKSNCRLTTFLEFYIHFNGSIKPQPFQFHESP